MTYRSPTKLKTSRNIALDRGTVPAGFAEPIMPEYPIAHDEATDQARVAGFGQKAPATIPTPFAVRGA